MMNKCDHTVVLALACAITALTLFLVFVPRTSVTMSAGMSIERFDAPGGAGKRVAVVHAQWCGHCKELLKPGGEWEQAKAASPGVTFEEVDEAGNKAMIEALGIDSFPDIRVLDAQGASVAKFEGDRTAAAIAEFAKRAT
jgi:thiol-disulfide isomerase/thioredoxin